MDFKEFSKKEEILKKQFDEDMKKLESEFNEFYKKTCFKKGNSAVLIIGKDCDGDLEFVEVVESEDTDCDFYIALSKDALNGRYNETIKNSFGEKITKNECKKIWVEQFEKKINEILEINEKIA